MSIESALQHAQQRIESAYNVLIDKGATEPATRNLANLASTANTITQTGIEGEGALEKKLLGTLGSLTLPLSITIIPKYGLYYGFYNSSTLTLANLENIVEVGSHGLQNTFENNTGLQSLDVSNVATLSADDNSSPNGTFAEMVKGCTNLDTLDFSGLTSIPNVNSSYTYPFYHVAENSGVTSTDFSSLATVGNYGLCNAFESLSGLTSADFSAVSTVGSYGMSKTLYGTNVSTLDLSSLTSVGDYGLSEFSRNNPSLTSVNLSSLSNINTYGLQYAFQNNPLLTSVTIPCTTIGNYGLFHAFDGDDSLSSISFPELETIPNTRALDRAFEYCDGIETVRFPKLTSITGSAALEGTFADNSSSYELDDESFPLLENISNNNYVWSNSTGLYALQFPSLTTISNCSYLFNGCTGLSIIDSDSFPVLGNNTYCSYMFNGCTGLTDAVFPGILNLCYSSGKSMNLQYFFNGCSNLKFARFPNLTDIGYNSSSDSTSYSYMYQAFSGCSNLITADFSKLNYCSHNGLRRTFAGSGLMGIEFPMLSGGNYNYNFREAWDGCSRLTSVSLAKLSSANTILNFYAAFNNCSNLRYVQFDTLSTIGTSSASDRIFQNAFTGCTKLEKLSFPNLSTIYNTSSNSSYAVFNNANYVKRMDFHKLGTVSGNGANYLFNNCSSLKELHFGISKQATIEAMSGYASLWGRGAGNADVYFDLVNTLTAVDTEATTLSCTRQVAYKDVTSISTGGGVELDYNITEIGSITKNNGVLSGFSASNYAKLPTYFTPGNNTWEIKLKLTTPLSFSADYADPISNSGYSIVPFRIYTNGKLKTWISSNGTSWNIASDVTSTNALSTNTTYYIRTKFTGTQYVTDVSTDNENWTNYLTVTSSSAISQDPTYKTTLLGIRQDDTGAILHPFAGSIDLKESYIKVNDELLWEGINYYTYNYTPVGSITFNNGVLSGFTTSNYAKTIPDTFCASASTASNWEVQFKIIFTSTGDAQHLYSQNTAYASEFAIAATDKPYLVIYSSGSSSAEQVRITAENYQLVSGNTYWIRYKFTGTRYSIELSTDGVTFTEEASLESTNNFNDRSASWCLGYNSQWIKTVALGIDLKDTYIKMNGSYWWQGVTDSRILHLTNPTSASTAQGTETNNMEVYSQSEPVYRLYWDDVATYSTAIQTYNKSNIYTKFAFINTLLAGTYTYTFMIDKQQNVNIGSTATLILDHPDGTTTNETVDISSMQSGTWVTITHVFTSAKAITGVTLTFNSSTSTSAYCYLYLKAITLTSQGQPTNTVNIELTSNPVVTYERSADDDIAPMHAWQGTPKYYKITEIPFMQPEMTSYGTLGSNNYACAVSSSYNNTSYVGYNVFNSNNSNWHTAYKSSSTPYYAIFYTKNELKLTSVDITNRSDDPSNVYPVRQVEIYGSNDNSSYTLLATHQNNVTGAAAVWTVDIPSANQGYYKYYKFSFLNDYGYGALRYIAMTGTNRQFTESTAEDYDYYDNGKRYTILTKPEHYEPLFKYENSKFDLVDEVTNTETYHSFGYQEPLTWSLRVRTVSGTYQYCYTHTATPAAGDKLYRSPVEGTPEIEDMEISSWTKMSATFCRAVVTGSAVYSGSVTATANPATYNIIKLFTKQENPTVDSTLYEYIDGEYVESSTTITAVG